MWQSEFYWSPQKLSVQTWQKLNKINMEVPMVIFNYLQKYIWQSANEDEYFQ